jgi:competence transcription factor ComK
MYIQQITYLFPGKYYRRQNRIWVFVSFVQKIAI